MHSLCCNENAGKVSFFVNMSVLRFYFAESITQSKRKNVIALKTEMKWRKNVEHIYWH